MGHGSNNHWNIIARQAGASTRRPDARAESEMKVARWQEMQLLLRAEEALKDGGEEVVEAFNEALEVLPSHLELDQEQRALAAQAFFGRARAHFRRKRSAMWWSSASALTLRCLQHNIQRSLLILARDDNTQKWQRPPLCTLEPP
eukprot:s129_g8.t1